MLVRGTCSHGLVHRLILILLIVPSSYHVTEANESPAASLFLQLYKYGARVLGNVLGFASLLLKSLNSPSTPDLIRRHGYPAETYYVRTADNAILELHRIPHGPTIEFFRFAPRIPVLLMHGIAQSSSDFLLNSPIKNSLGFFLSDEGYDVWLGNLRGNLNKNSGNGNFSWNYSFHEMGMYDIPAIVQFISKHTGFSKIHYIGFSMGTTVLTAALSKVPELNSRIKVGVLLGPSVFINNHFNGWLRLVGPLAKPGDVLQNTFGSIPVLHPWAARVLHKVLPIICHPRIDLIGICLAVSQIMFGHDKGQITKEKLATITQVSPTPISSKLLIHYMQQLASGRYCEYDYGADKNLQLYGSARPPNYNLSNVVAPISLVVGKQDFLAHPKDALTLASSVKNVADVYFVPYQDFYHLDFCYAEDVGVLVYQHVLKILRLFDRH